MVSFLGLILWLLVNIRRTSFAQGIQLRGGILANHTDSAGSTASVQKQHLSQRNKVGSETWIRQERGRQYVSQIQSKVSSTSLENGRRGIHCSSRAP